MAIESKQLNYPGWYVFVKWVFPITLALGAASLVGLVLLGMLPIPASMGMLAWAPVVFSQLEMIPAAAIFILSTSLVGSMVGIISSIFFRGLLLGVTEEIAMRRGIIVDSQEKQIADHAHVSKSQQKTYEEDLIRMGAECDEKIKDFERFKGGVETITGIRAGGNPDEMIVKLNEFFNNHRECKDKKDFYNGIEDLKKEFREKIREGINFTPRKPATSPNEVLILPSAAGEIETPYRETPLRTPSRTSSGN